ncbi:uncharacterized protein LOC108253501 [Diaphorina citri]|uniref:Uncharacterized protein LOC108253501 n=1 Tax=Diaphorina citri TaxID=121845 RepID=A0A1S4ELN8_DIACI|nr:uncharacterized protein LOC108253501 [Diaphorina citri]
MRIQVVALMCILAISMPSFVAPASISEYWSKFTNHFHNPRPIITKYLKTTQPSALPPSDPPTDETSPPPGNENSTLVALDGSEFLDGDDNTTIASTPDIPEVSVTPESRKTRQVSSTPTGENVTVQARNVREVSSTPTGENVTVQARNVREVSTAKTRVLFSENTSALQRKHGCPSAKARMPFSESTNALQRKHGCPSAEARMLFSESTNALQRKHGCSSAEARMLFSESTNALQRKHGSPKRIQ